MATAQLQLGKVEAMTQSIIYALPPKRCLMFTTDTTATFQQSNDVAFAASVAVAFTNGQQEVAGAFIRCTSASVNVMLKGV